ncbi:hypothetical protein [Bacillus velezensis]|uniref:hypothetical protein n=1 Tax=Bacillus velezensis TaxID=492670 RepID=UPI0011AAAF0D|nr:hypothetical protein [Bacillus velezensis]
MRDGKEGEGEGLIKRGDEKQMEGFEEGMKGVLYGDKREMMIKGEVGGEILDVGGKGRVWGENEV